MPTRPTPDTITSGMMSWDASVTANFNLIFQTPLPLARYANAAALPAAADYEHCLCIQLDTGALKYSDGSAWKTVTVT